MTAVLSSPLHALYGIALVLSGLPLFAIFAGRRASKITPGIVSPE
jgi:hypothetical protein